jgi:hypothetical protein
LGKGKGKRGRENINKPLTLDPTAAAASRFVSQLLHNFLHSTCGSHVAACGSHAIISHAGRMLGRTFLDGVVSPDSPSCNASSDIARLQQTK